ncbi:MAG: M28 family peptidase [Planctomycetota bacterium]|nr:M28 family peptidase [Planctomycetota bacterium]
MPTARFAVALLVSLANVAAQDVDEAAVEFFRNQGLEPDHSRVMEHLSWICDVHGPRLTGSPNMRRAQDWAIATLGEWGLQNAKKEKWGPFGRGWRCDRAGMRVVGDNPWPVLAYAKAWSPSLGRVTAEVVNVYAMDADTLRNADLTGKVVLTEPPRAVSEPFDGVSRRFDSEDLLVMADQRADAGRSRQRRSAEASRTNFRTGFQRRGQMLEILATKNPLAMIDRGYKGDYGTVFVGGARAMPGPDGGRTSARAVGAKVVPQFTIAVEHYNRMCRLLDKGFPVHVELDLETTFFDEDLYDYNVVAEIPGSDPELGSQVVMMGAHLDSWHTGTGSTDNGSGSAVAMEAARLIARYVQESGVKPRRTVRVALWSGEEQGLLGSRAYVREHYGETGKPNEEHAQISGYFNLDNGTGRIRGVYLQGNEAIAATFRSWLRPFHDIGATTLTLNNTGGTDHLAFSRVGIPGFQFIQDPVSYSTRTHHSNMDVWDHAVADDLRQASTIMAAFVWHTAQRDELLPRMPLPEPVEASARRGR